MGGKGDGFLAVEITRWILLVDNEIAEGMATLVEAQFHLFCSGTII